MRKILCSALLALLLATACWPQQPDNSRRGQKQPAPSAAQPGAATPDRAQAYYYYALAHMYEEMAMAYNRQDYLNKAIDAYRQAMQHDPDSTFLANQLADLYARTGRTRDAVLEAEELIKRDPRNNEARRLLGRIYLRLLGDRSEGKIQPEMVNRAVEQFEKIAESDATDVDSRVTLGRLYRITNDFTKAEKVLKEALQIQADSEEALTTLAAVYIDTSQFNSAVKLLEQVTGKGGNPRAWAALGSAYEQAREYDKAIDAYRKAIEQDKENPELQRALGQTLLYAERWDEALALYTQMASADPQDGQAFLRLGQIYRQLGKHTEAEENLKKAAGLMPDSLEVPYNLALLAETRGNTEEATRILNQLLDKTAKPTGGEYSVREKSNRAIFQERLGILQRNSGEHAAAEKTFRAMMEADEENAVRGASQLIETLRQAKQYERALAEADAAVKRFPEERSLKMLHATVLAENGQAERAEGELKAQLQNKPSDREIWLTIAQVNERAKRYPQAEQAVAEAEKLSTRKEEKEFVYFMWGAILERQKKYDAAEVQFRKALEIDPKSAMTLNYLGYMLADRGVRLEEARKFIEGALAAEPNNGAYLDSMGWVMYRLNKMDLAEQYLLKALQRNQHDAAIYDHLGDVYYATGRIREAVAQWQTALTEWQRAASHEVDPQDVAEVQKKLEDAKVRLAQQTGKK